MLYDAAAGDFDGDGRSELLVLGSLPQSGLYVWNGTTLVRDTSKFYPYLLRVGLLTPTGYRVGDFNGDGKSDILAINQIAGGFHTFYEIHLSNGTTFVPQGVNTWEWVPTGPRSTPATSMVTARRTLRPSSTS
ncbi:MULTISPECIES: VCBS repeat-containing protein [unclassified Chelatococcus]|uniref:FG-GAP repeat domain-containing protein n=1 Tax=unclassified Chelatococcus TaxID=2638111 RepID=UPI0025C0A3C6|nr:VCBS repeat-containing protein [Chelatococcus sp.]